LVEILVSLAILAGAIAVILQACARGAYLLRVVQHRVTAYTFASAKMADLELTYRQGVIPKPSGEFWAGQDAFQWTVDSAPLAEHPELELVTLTVGWRQGAKDYASQFSLVRRLPQGES
jgi:hypothetical protein